MSPLPPTTLSLRSLVTRDVGKLQDPDGLVLEAWAQGYLVGSLIILSCICLANMRKGVLLHKLILLELVLGVWQAFSILLNEPIFAWWLSVGAIPLNISWVLHNVIAWMKIKPFLSKFWSRFFILTVCLSIPYWIVEIWANFTYFHNVNTVFLKTRPWEALCRDPWWLAAAIILFYNIKTKYELSALQIVQISPRFAVMLGAMLISLAFIIADVLSVTGAFNSALPVGINPFWKLSFVFKCLTDAVVLDDFKTALDRLRAFKISRLGSFAMDNSDSRYAEHSEIVQTSNNWNEPPTANDRPVPVAKLPAMPGTDSNNTGVGSIPPGSQSALDKEYAGIARGASRDRDIEENGIGTIDYGDVNRQESSAHMLGRQSDHWPSVSTDDVDMDYAQAMREMTHDDHTGPPTKESKFENGK